MTDKSFGDHTDRTVVKNPLLSTAVVGLSLEDLTHNAVILPVAQTPGLIASQETRQVKCHPHDHHIQPSGDTNTATLTLANRPSDSNAHIDDFDVNEYFARLQGTRYISAPPHASLNTSTNIPEENLEEISLDEEKVVQGTLSSEIAQNLSQLPQVLPHVANAVFNSFSSMLSMRSREQTPGAVKDSGYKEVELMSQGGEVRSDERKEALKEPPVGNTSNSYRITTKKKAYAQIPGLSTDYNTQHTSCPNANQPPPSLTHPSSYVVPNYPQADIPKLSPIGVPIISTQNTQNSYVNDSDATKTTEGVMTNAGTSVDLFPSKEESFMGSVTDNAQISGPDVSLVGHNVLGNINKDPHGSVHSKSDSFLSQNLVKSLNPSFEFQGDQGFVSAGKTAVASKTTMSESVLIFNPLASSPLETSTTVSNISSIASEFPMMSSSSSILATSQQMASIIPPPTMFSNESRKDTNLKTLLPPSIARRLSGNQPIIKQQTAPLAPPVNFFIPPPIDSSCTVQNFDGVIANIVSQTTTQYPASVLTEPHNAMTSFPPALPSIGGYTATASSTASLQASALGAPSEASMQPPTFFNPASMTTPVESPQRDPPGFPPVSSSQTILGPPKQLLDPASITTNIPDPIKATPDPPKIAPGNVNFRLTKKRPQYYSGPIEGVGSISNNVKPIIAPIEPTNAFQGAVYTPQSIPEQDTRNINKMPSFQPPQEMSAPFNLNQAFEDNGTANRQYNFIQGRHETQPQQEYNTVFDFSRQTNEEYKQSKDQEGSGFGIIGSLKSKLSSLDINKIQNSVTTFFDPAYNSVATETTNHQGNQTNSQSENASANNAPNYDNLQIFIPHQDNSQQYYGSNYTDSTQNQQDIAYDTLKDNQQNYYQNPDSNVHNYSYYHKESHNAPQPSHRQDQNAEPFSNNLLSIYENSPVPPQNVLMANVFGNQQNNENELNCNTNIDTQCDNDSLISKEITSNVENTLSIDNSLSSSNVSGLFNEHTKETEVDTYQYSGSPNAPEQTAIDNEIYYLQDNINNISLHERHSSDSNLFSSDESKYNKHETYKMEDVTSQMIENITSPIQLTNPVEVPFIESDVPQEIRGDFETEQCEEITNITQETIESIQIKTAIEFLEKRDSELFENNYIEHTDIKNPGWCDRQVQEPTVSVTTDHDYTFHNDPNAVGFFSGNSLFFDNIPNNTRDEIQAEFKNVSDESSVVNARQMSIPTAPPVEDLDDNKSDGTGDLDVHLIEQDAKADFPGFEEFVIEPSETDDDKIEVKDQDKTTSEDKIEDIDSFTHRIDKFKHMEDTIDPVVEPTQLFDIPTSKSPSISIASYFDTGNYAAETHYRNSLTSPTSLNMYNVGQPVTNLFATANPIAEVILDAAKQEAKIPQTIDIPHLVHPGFTVDVPKPCIPDTNTQTSVTSTVTQSNVKQITEEIAIGAVLPDVNIYELLPNERNQPLIPPGFTTAILKPVVSECETIPSHVSSFCKGESSGISPASATSDPSNSSTLFNKQKTEKISHNSNIVDSKSRDMIPLDSIPTSNLPSTGSKQASSVTSKSIFFDKSTPIYQCSALFEIKSTIEKTPRENASSIQNMLAASNVQTGVTNTTPILRPDPSKSPPAIQRMSQGTNSANETPVLQTPAQNAQTLPDPLNFFATTATAEDARKPESDASFNRLASYFASPTKTDTKKSFFELSQGQDHLRKVNQQLNDQHTANLQLMKDLTTTDFYQPSEEQVVKTVNYFMVEYNHMRLGNNSFARVLNSTKSRLNNTVNIDNNPPNSNVTHKDSSVKKKRAVDVLDNCKYCCDKTQTFIDKVDINKQDIKVRTAMDNKGDESGSVKDAPSKDGDQVKPSNVSFNLNMEENNEETVMAQSDNRLQNEYVPVKHHWFYRVDIEGKSTWKGFSVADSNSLEAAFHSPDLNDDTVVATDGGRYDVNVKGRLRVAVYWNDKPTNVRRCSWFYKGTTDARYVPYTESVAEKLEEEYRHGVTTGEWHRRLPLPNNETVVMHGVTVMVHFLQGAPADAWSAPSSYMFAKKTVYRSLPKITVAEDQTQRIDHLVMFVHGAGESRKHAEKLQSTTRPRVVRRGCDESEIEDQEPSRIDHLLLLCHGVGSVCDLRFRSVEEVVDDFRATSVQLIQGHYKNSYDNGIVGRIEVLPVSWHASLHGGERGVDRRLSRISLPSIPLLRGFTNDTVLDVLFYTSPAFCQTIIETVCQELNRIYSLFVSRNPEFRGGVSLGGHSLGSVILYDLLCHQGEKAPNKEYINDAASTGMPNIVYPKLEFTPACLYALGSPIAMFECIRGVESLGEDFKLPTCSNFFNIFHPYDPIAYRIEPLINPQLKGVSPYLIPHHKGRKRMHLELKETVARVGADIKQRVFDSIKATWSSMWRTQPPTNEQLEKVVEEEIEREALNENPEDIHEPDVDLDVSSMVGKLNGGRRVDYVLQEAPFEMINEYLFSMSSHVCYWESEDTMLLMLREIYESQGVQPDSTLPQQTMSVQRTRFATDKDDSSYCIGTDQASSSK